MRYRAEKQVRVKRERKMKKVLFVIYALGYGGAERSLVNLLQELPPEAYQVDLLLFIKKGDFMKQLPAWVRVLDTPAELAGLYAPVRKAGKYAVTKVVGTVCGKIARRKKKATAAFRWKHFYSRQIQPLPGHYDVAVAYVGAEIMYFVRDKVSADKKAVWIHNDYRTAGYSKIDDGPYFADMDAIVSVSNECVEVLQQEFPEYREKLHCIENITSSALIKKQAEAFQPEEYTQCSCNILSVGRLWPQKGFDMAVEAARILKKRGFAFRWFVIGDGYLRKSLQQQIQDAGVEQEFILLGTRNNPYPYIKNCTVLAQTSRYEGKSVVLDEGKILCAPIVTTAYPTAADQILAGAEGLITEMSPEGIADGIAELLTNEARQQELKAYLSSREYGNQQEAAKYRRILDD